MENSARPSSNWLRNPANKRQTFGQHVLPSLLFRECRLNCVEDPMDQPTNMQETCISNCQDKTYQAFDMYMRMQHYLEMKRDYRSYVDVSRYTEMEIEHGHDTDSEIEINRPTKVFAPQVSSFIEANNTENKDVKTAAFN
jgi:hypothetical protein